MAKQRLAAIISLDERRKRLTEEKLREANRRMIEAEHALFVALRLAGHRGEEMPSASRSLRRDLPGQSAPVIRLRPRRKRAA